MWISLFLIALGTLGLAFVAEVAMLMVRGGAWAGWRPSVLITTAAVALQTALYHLFWSVFLGWLGKIWATLRRFLLWLRDTFFWFVPRDILLQALTDLGASLRHVWRIPRGAYEGIWDAIKDASLGRLIILFLYMATLPVTLELVALVAGAEHWRVSHWLVAAALALYNTGWEVGHAFYYIWDIKELVVRVLSNLFGFLPLELIRRTTTDVYTKLWSLADSPIRGLATGFCTIFASDIGKCTLDEMVAPRPALILLTCGVALVIGLLWGAVTGQSQHPEARQPLADADDEEEDDDDDEEEEEEVIEGRALRATLHVGTRGPRITRGRRPND